MNKYRKIAIAIIVLTVILAFWLYGTEYSSSAEPQKISETLTDYLFNDDVQVTVIQTEKIDNRMLVSFTDKRYENFMGLAVFKRGLNLRWLPLSANYSSGISVEAHPFTIGSKDYVAIYGINCVPNITYYEYVTTDSNPEILYSNSVSESNFIDIYEFKTGYWPKLRLFDSVGNDLAPELRKSRVNQNIPSVGVGTAEDFMINVFCLFILLIGFAIARFFWIFKPE
ncbi:hypothetical protein ACHOLT_09440 [Desulfitobacterium sp. Sab5]|uniref:hypothetical protein n=1 Tax=Desulfitobacterium nosdiversum TaxID=3375356 RepID=UPI003CF95EEA